MSKRTLLALLAAAILIPLVGCQHRQCRSYDDTRYRDSDCR